MTRQPTREGVAGALLTTDIYIDIHTHSECVCERASVCEIEARAWSRAARVGEGVSEVW